MRFFLCISCGNIKGADQPVYQDRISFSLMEEYYDTYKVF